MGKILGIDLGTNSIGWALVEQNDASANAILKLGVRVCPLSIDEQRDFVAGKSITTNAVRTSYRAARRNLQRYKLRREALIKLFIENDFIKKDTIRSESGKNSTFETYHFREKAVTEEISMEAFARVLLQINKKRGYKSGKKVNSMEDGQIIDAMDVAERLYNESITPAELTLEILRSGHKDIPDFYRSDLQNELDRIWNFQKQFFPDILTDDFRKQIFDKGKTIVAKRFLANYSIYTAQNNGENKKIQPYLWRVQALNNRIDADVLAFVISDLTGMITNSSGYLGSISDRSKELHFNKMTVGQYLMSELRKNPNYSFKNKVFYRRDYLDEFNVLWDKQSQYHPQLTNELKHRIANMILFYQRRLKSQNDLIGFCEFESREIETTVDGTKKKRTIGLKVIPKSALLFQEYKMWCILNNVMIKDRFTKEIYPLSQENKEMLFRELSVKNELSAKDVLKFVYGKSSVDFDLNYKKIEGNRTQAQLFEAYSKIINLNGNGEYDFSKMKYNDIINVVESKFGELGFKTDFLHHHSLLDVKEYERQPIFKLWHILYSFESDDSRSGNEKQVDKIIEITGFDRANAARIANIGYSSDYGSLSSKAIRKILPSLMEGNQYDVACTNAGYRHSASSLTKEEISNRELKDRLEVLKRNSLRNPVVEKILNQMVHVVNGVLDEYGKLDEIHIELARELKKNAKEREAMTESINKMTKQHDEYVNTLMRDFGLTYVSRNDIIRYKLYLELESRGFKTLYSNSYIPREKLFTNEFNVEHIIPQAKLFDDSFSNKTLETSYINGVKSNKTAFDFMMDYYGAEEVDRYRTEVEILWKKGVLSKSKYEKLLLCEADIKSGFIERDLRDSQYIAKKAKSMLFDVVPVVVSTIGSITDRLRRDWQLVDVLKELNWNKYEKLGMTEVKEKNGDRIYNIKDWTKRNDHRHHAMDALTIAFTRHNHIQYLNNLNARSNRDGKIYAIEKKELHRDENGKLIFNSPIEPVSAFRAEAKKQLENVLVSIKAKNKVVTRNRNQIHTKAGCQEVLQQTPRGQLHNETIYAMRKRYATKEEKVGASFDLDKINRVSKKVYRDLLLARLEAFDGNPKKAFTGKNSLNENPIYLNRDKTKSVPLKVQLVDFETVFTKRDSIGKNLNIDKVVDKKIKEILLARLSESNGDANKAFSNLSENPIYDHRGAILRRVAITGIKNGEAIHRKRDKNGELIYDEQGNSIPNDYVSTSNNHHVAIYQDVNGDYEERIVSFYEAVALASQNQTVVDYDYRKSDGWRFLFTLKQNEYFVFPNPETGFNPLEIDLTDRDNYSLISPNLYRVQKIATKNYVFRHHLETMVANEDLKMKNVIFKRITSLKELNGVVKVRVNSIGMIVQVGES